MQHPRDMGDWMRAIERGIKETRRGISSVVTSVVGELRDEVAADSVRHPTAPIELTYQTAVYTETISSRRWARVLVDFPDVTKATDGTDLVIEQYELWGRNVTGDALAHTTDAVAGLAAPGLTMPGLAATPANKALAATIDTGWKLLRTSPTSSIQQDSFIPGSIWEFKVRAMGKSTVTPGEFSITFQVQMFPDDTPPPQPTAPILVIQRGVIRVDWDGMAVTGAMPADFRYLSVAHGDQSSPTNEVARFYRGGGFTVLSGLEYYKPQFIRFQAVDQSGNRSPWSQQAVGYTTPLVDEDVILSKIDAAKTQLLNVDAGVSILSDTIATRHLAITEDMTAALAEFLHVRAGMIEANAVEADSIAAGAVTATKLEADLALVTAIIAGDPLGTHAQMDENGFRVFAIDDNDGVPNEVVRMGVAETDDYFAITRSNGTLAATISQDGLGSFSSIAAADTIYYKGKELSTLLNEGGGKVIAAAFRTSPSVYDAVPGGPFQPYLRVEATLYPGRLYKIWTSPIRVNIDKGIGCTVSAAFTTGATLATVGNSSAFMQASVQPDSNGGKASVTMQELFAVLGTVPVQYSIILMFGVQETAAGATGAAGIRADGFQPVRLVIEDVGVNSASIANGVWLDGTAPPALARNTRVTQWGTVNSGSFDGGNNSYPFNPGQMFQGLSPAGYGNLKSIAVFNDMTAELAGATINYIRVYFNFNHWYNNSGGTARIGLHAHTGVPGSFTGNLGVVVESGGWPKPGARWVDIPAAYWDGFKSGAYKGVYLEGDGSYGTYGYADRPTIEISYTK